MTVFCAAWRSIGVWAVISLIGAVIAAAWALADTMPGWGWHPVYALCLGVMAGGVAQLAVQIPALRAVGMMPRLALTPGGLRRSWRHPGVQRVLAQMGPQATDAERARRWMAELMARSRCEL